MKKIRSRRKAKRPAPIRWAAEPLWRMESRSEGRENPARRLLADLMAALQAERDRSAAFGNWKGGKSRERVARDLREWLGSGGGIFERRKEREEKNRSDEATQLHRQAGRRAYRW